MSLGLDDSSRGRRAERYTLNLHHNISLSFYVKNEFINYVLTNPLGDVIENRISISMNILFKLFFALLSMFISLSIIPVNLDIASFPSPISIAFIAASAACSSFIYKFLYSQNLSSAFFLKQNKGLLHYRKCI